MASQTAPASRSDPKRNLAAPVIEIMIESKRWQAEPRAQSVIRKAVQTAAQVTATRHAELAIVLTHDSAIRALNRQWRGFDKATNVLSFPANDSGPTRAQASGPKLLGDIVIAYQTTAREAKDEGKPFRHHLSHLAVHGFLHLVGYDHEVDGDATRMERLETRILARLAVPDPYRDHDKA